MSLSQFTIYTSSDRDGPGPVMGTTGSLISVLNACLVNGYGSGSAWYKPAAGWSKPFPDVSASVGLSPRLGCFKQASGSNKCTLFVNDSGPNATSTSREARIVGWEVMTELTGSGNLGTIYTGSNSVGSGYGQFPTSAQLLTNGFCVARKSTSADTVGRAWFVAADAYTAYVWILTGDIANSYFHFMFGDMFALAGDNDLWRCCIYGRYVENSALGVVSDMTSVLAFGGGYSTNSQVGNSVIQNAQPGHYIVRSMAGTNGSMAFTKKGDSNSPSGQSGASSYPNSGNSMSGMLQTPNSTDNSFYVQPIQIVDPASVMIRGRLRGLYHPCHPVANISDGQIVVAGGDYVGKTFMAIKYGCDTTGAWLIEISPTVETN